MAVVTNGLVFWYDGINNIGEGTQKNNATTWKDLSGNGNDGTITSGVWKDKCLMFDGTNTWVNCGVHNETTVTVEVIVSFSKIGATSGNYNSIIGNWQSGGYGMQLENNCHIMQVNIGGSWYTAFGSECITGKIIHLVGTFDGSTVKLYENGELVSSTTASGTIKAPSNSTVLSIGSNPNGTAIGINPLNGLIFSARLYNRALTQDEVTNNYEADIDRFNMPEMYYKVRQSTLNTIADEIRRITGVSDAMSLGEMITNLQNIEV